MKIGIVSDGKFGDRSCEIIREPVHAISTVSPCAGARVKTFTHEMEKIIDKKMTRG
jgi:hypothetical protein